MTLTINQFKVNPRWTMSDYVQGEGRPYFLERLRMVNNSKLTPEKILNIIYTEFKTNKKLLSCSVASFMGALFKCVELGLFPGNGLGHCYFVPFFNNKHNTYECSFILGYKGMINLASRSSIIANAHLVYKNDGFEYEFGNNAFLKHVPAKAERGEVVFSYADARFPSGQYSFEVMNFDETEKIRIESKAKSPDSPWVKFPDEMRRKCPLRRQFNYLPISVEMDSAISADNIGIVIDKEIADLCGEIGSRTKSDQVSTLINAGSTNQFNSQLPEGSPIQQAKKFDTLPLFGEVT